MNDLKALFKQSSFQINPLVLKNVSKLDISLNDFLLLLYFINVNHSLDLENIKEIIGLNEENILNSYSSLISKGLIEIIVSKENGRVNETISLDMFYDKLVLNSPKEEVKQTDIYTKFENEFGRSISPMEYETINNWLSNGVSEEMITSALREAVISNACNLRYIDKIIYEWTKKKVNVNKSSQDEEYVPLYNCDWLGGMNDEESEFKNRYIK